MRILHIDPDDLDNPVAGGSPVRTFEIYRRLADKHQITVLTPSYDGCKREEVKEGIRYIRVGRKWRDHQSTHFISFYFMAPFVARRLEYDLLVEDLMPPTAATLTPIINKKPVIASVQWFFAKAWAEQFKLPFHWYQPLGLKFYKHFIVLTEDLKSTIAGYNSRATIDVIPEGVEDVFFKQNVKSENFILFLGRVENHQKGLNLLIEAYSRIADKIKQNLVIAGDGIDMEAMKALVNKKGLEKRTTFVGKVGLQQKTELLSKCDFVAMPSKYETFGMVATESFASAKTVVAFDIPCLRTLTRKEISLTVPAFDVEQYSKALLKLATNAELAMQMGEKARDFARNYQWDKIAQAQEELYFKVVGESKN